MRDGEAEAGQQDQTGSLTESLALSVSTDNAGAGAVCCQFTFQTLHATSQDGFSLEFVAATECNECNIQDARGRGLCIQLTFFILFSI